MTSPKYNQNLKLLQHCVPGSKFVKFFMSILKWQVNSISNFASLFIVIMHNSPLRFQVIHFVSCIKRSNESSNFDSCGCYGENLPNSSCHFPNYFSNFASHSCVMKYISSALFYLRQIKVQTFLTF